MVGMSGPERAEHSMSNEGESLDVFDCAGCGCMDGWGSCDVGLTLSLAMSQKNGR